MVYSEDVSSLVRMWDHSSVFFFLHTFHEEKSESYEDDSVRAEQRTRGQSPALSVVLCPCNPSAEDARTGEALGFTGQPD